MGRTLSLDVLRGLAISMVIIGHFFSPTVGPEGTVFFSNAGVVLFFYLSGVLMDRALSLDRNLMRFAVRRAFRILPMYWVSIALVSALSRGASSLQILANATFTAPILGFERMLGVYWTLYIEVLFYLLAPFIYLLLPKYRAALIGLVAITLAAFGLVRSGSSGAPFYMLFCLCGMQIGGWSRGRVSRTDACNRS